jgi:hypothetical protein
MLTINDIGVAELRQWCDVLGWKDCEASAQDN